MIARLWHGEVPYEKGAGYHRYLLQTGLKDYAAVSGNRGVFIFKKNENDVTHFYTLTLWDDENAIKDFAGEDWEQARYYPEDENYLLTFEPLVTHFDVLEHSFTG